MFPLYDTTRTRVFPLVNLGLILLNALAFLFEIRMTPDALQNFIFTRGLIPARLLADPNGTWETIFSSMFLHGGAGSGIAWWAHVGGFLFGMVMVFFLARRQTYRSY